MKTDKILTFLGFSFILSVLVIIARTPLAVGYEISIYNVYPIYFWLLVVACFACGLGIIIHQAFNEQQSRWWIAGISILVFTTMIVLLLPMFRGYLIYGRADVTEHIGRMKDIILTGHVVAPEKLGENFYPALHILGASINYLTGLSPESLSEIIPPLFSFLYMLFIYLLSREISQSRGQSLLITAFGTPLLFANLSLKFSPNEQLFLLFPFIIFIYCKARISRYNSMAYTIIFILILLIVPFFHPGEETLCLLLLLLCIDVSVLLYKKITERKGKILTGKFLVVKTRSFNACIILVVTWFIWISSFYAFSRESKKIISWLVLHIGEPVSSGYTSLFGQANVSVWDFFKLFIETHGQMILYILLGGILSLIVWRMLFSRRQNTDTESTIFSFLYIIFSILMLISFTQVVALVYYRILRYVILAATILSGLVLYKLFFNKKVMGGVITIFIILISMSIGLFNIFSSPISREFGQQVTNMEFIGLRWFSNHQNGELFINEIDLRPGKFFPVVSGFTSLPKNVKFGDYDEAWPPDHFGYNEHNTFGASFTDDRYFMNSKLAIIAYPEIFPEYKNLWRFDPGDFQKLKEDVSVNSIYNNGEFFAYYVYGQAGQEK